MLGAILTRKAVDDLKRGNVLTLVTDGTLYVVEKEIKYFGSDWYVPLVALNHNVSSQLDEGTALNFFKVESWKLSEHFVEAMDALDEVKERKAAAGMAAHRNKGI